MSFSFKNYYNFINPSTYMGIEGNFKKQEKGNRYRVLACFPDIYSIGMSSLGFRIITDYFINKCNVFTDICFSPWIDVIDEIQKGKIQLYSHFYQMEINEFDLIAFSVNYEMQVTTMIKMMQLFGLFDGDKLKQKKDRPLIIIGGTIAFSNPSIFSQISDMVFCGEIEAGFDLVIDSLKNGKSESKEVLLKDISKMPGMYVPEYFQYEKHSKKGYIFSNRIKRVFVKDLNKIEFYPENWITPVNKIIHDKLTLEIMRGCTQGCRFCQAGMIYRPHRERKSSQIVSVAEKFVKQTGYEELSLLSLSTGDYSEIEKLLVNLHNKFENTETSVSIPSQRLDKFSPKTAQLVSKVRKSGITFAPEAGSERLRKVINKKISDKDIFNGVETAIKYGWKVIKLYFMIGFPTETDEDVKQIAYLINDILAHGKKTKRNIRVNVSVNIFIPKPHTPFQRCRLITEDEFNNKINLIKRNLKKNVKFDYSHYDYSYFESLVSRGDFYIGDILKNIAFSGYGLDCWRENFNLDLWNNSFDKYLKSCYNIVDSSIKPDWTYSWELLDTGLRKNFLDKEFENAINGIEREDCFITKKCFGCGICNI